MDATRRGFFRLTAGAVALAAVPGPVKAKGNVPTIWADGIHNDAPGLNALIRGEVVEFADTRKAAGIGWRGTFLDLGGYTYRCEDTVNFEHDNRTLAHMTIYSTADTALFGRGEGATFADFRLHCLSENPNSVGIYWALPERPFVPDGPSAYCLTYGGKD